MLCGTKGKKAGTQTNSCFLALILLSFIRQQWTNFRDPNWKKQKEPTQTAWCFFTYYPMKLWSTKRLVNERSKNILLYIAVSTGINIMQTLNVLDRFPDQNHSPPKKKITVGECQTYLLGYLKVTATPMITAKRFL
jgi:hypothetical protein